MLLRTKTFNYFTNACVQILNTDSSQFSIKYHHSLTHNYHKHTVLNFYSQQQDCVIINTDLNALIIHIMHQHRIWILDYISFLINNGTPLLYSE